VPGNRPCRRPLGHRQSKLLSWLELPETQREPCMSHTSRRLFGYVLVTKWQRLPAKTNDQRKQGQGLNGHKGPTDLVFAIFNHSSWLGAFSFSSLKLPTNIDQAPGPGWGSVCRKNITSGDSHGTSCSTRHRADSAPKIEPHLPDKQRAGCRLALVVADKAPNFFTQLV
jgi:hypothetical protein